MEPEKNRKKDWRLFKRLVPYVKKYIFLVIPSIFLLLMTDILGVLQPYLVQVGIDLRILKGDAAGLAATAKLLLLVMISGFILQVVFNYIIQFVGQKILYDIRMDVFSHITYLSNDYFDKTSTGKTLTYATSDVEAIRDFISEGVVKVIGLLIRLGFILVAMIMINVRLALLTFLTIPLFAVTTFIFRKAIRNGYRGVRKYNARIHTTLVESITGIREIFQFNFQKKSKELFKESNQQYLDSYLGVVHAYSLYFPVIEFISHLSMILILLYSHFNMGVTVRPGEIFAFFTYIHMFFRPLRELAEKFNMFQSAMSAAERIFRFLDTDGRIVYTPSGTDPRRSIRGKIEFNHVTFSYNDGNPVLKDISFSIQPGEQVALVGYTGSGKTTIINLLNRLYDVDSGSISIDGADIRDHDLVELRKRIATIPQEPFFFAGTVADNISLYNPSVTRADVLSVSQKAQIDYFIRKFPRQYDENIMESGGRLSAGEKQLISFARTFLSDSDIVILDEATSNIDSETEALMDSAAQELLRDKTSIIIAHRLSTIQQVDRILVLHQGRLVEEGNHDMLLKKGGIYSQLSRYQVLGSREIPGM